MKMTQLSPPAGGPWRLEKETEAVVSRFFPSIPSAYVLFVTIRFQGSNVNLDRSFLGYGKGKKLKDNIWIIANN